MGVGGEGIVVGEGGMEVLQFVEEVLEKGEEGKATSFDDGISDARGAGDLPEGRSVMIRARSWRSKGVEKGGKGLGVRWVDG